ncbi:MAG: DNA polymerase III subunit chi [Pseudomonadota bacterium]
MGEVRFYHLTQRPLEAVLPIMLERSLSRGWRVLIRGTEPARLNSLDAHLWTHAEESFLPHGQAGQGRDEDQPILLSSEPGCPNGAEALFLIDGAESPTEEMTAMAMTAILFDDGDKAALEHARGQWRSIAGSGLKAVYWAQGPRGWEKKAES